MKHHESNNFCSNWTSTKLAAQATMLHAASMWQSHAFARCRETWFQDHKSQEHHNSWFNWSLYVTCSKWTATDWHLKWKWFPIACHTLCSSDRWPSEFVWPHLQRHAACCRFHGDPWRSADGSCACVWPARFLVEKAVAFKGGLWGVSVA